MTLYLEWKKLKRTGYLPAIICGGLLASAFPVLNMLVRSEIFTSLSGDPFVILMDANWQMMAMLNILLMVCGTCSMYHTEYADNGIQKMSLLPLRTEALFFGKLSVTVLSSALIILMESAVLIGCALYWFPEFQVCISEFLKNVGFELTTMLPTVVLALLIASFCRNMWLSLGINVILVFIFSTLPQNQLFLNLCPFSSPYQLFSTIETNGRTALFIGAYKIPPDWSYTTIRRYFI